MSTQKNNFSIRTDDVPVGRYHVVDRRKVGLSDYILQNKKGNWRWRDPGWNTGELRGKQMMISVLSIQILFPFPVYILQEPGP